jgi:hypothetical protein
MYTTCLPLWARRSLVATLATIALCAHAQEAPAIGEKITGQQLQAWLDAKFSYAGVHATSQCTILNVAQGNGRVLFIRCPNGWAEKLAGTARVEGDSYCTRFPIPNTPATEECVTWHSLGQWKFEQRKGSTLDTQVILLPQGLQGQR